MGEVRGTEKAVCFELSDGRRFYSPRVRVEADLSMTVVEPFVEIT